MGKRKHAELSASNAPQQSASIEETGSVARKKRNTKRDLSHNPKESKQGPKGQNAALETKDNKRRKKIENHKSERRVTSVKRIKRIPEKAGSKNDVEEKSSESGGSIASSWGLSPNWQSSAISTASSTPESTPERVKSPLITLEQVKKRPRDSSWPSVVGVDCEMVGGGANGSRSLLAKIAIVDETGKVLMNDFVKPGEKVTDFRKRVTGIRWEHLKTAKPFKAVRDKALKLLKDKVVVGHALENDFSALIWVPADRYIRDTSHFLPLREGVPGVIAGSNNKISLKRLSAHWLQRDIQQGHHDPVEDAQAAIDLYILHRKQWEAELR